jgi:rhomboid protease GluP
MLFLYLSSGIGGNLLSGVLSPAAFGVGASTSVFGLVGFLLAYILTNAKFMVRRDKGQIWYLAILVSLLIFLNLNQGPDSDPKVDNWGHLGGLITGILVGTVITENYDA